MGLYDIARGESPVSNFHGGTFPIAKDTAQVAEEIQKYAVIASTPEGLAEVTLETLEDVVGIAAEASTDGGVAYYATGEFQEETVVFDDSIDTDTLKTALAKINIYLK